MKKVLLIIACLISFVEMWSQQPEAWFYKGKQWARLSIGYQIQDKSTTTSVIVGSEEIDGLTYWKVCRSYKENLSDLAFSGYYLREEGKKIYRYYPNTKEETLFLDFNVKKGDSWITENSMDIKIIEVTDTILPNGDETRRKCIKTGLDEYHVFEIWVEGIGSLHGGIEGLWIGRTGGGSTLLCCHDESQSFYVAEPYNTCFLETKAPSLVVPGKVWAVYSQSVEPEPKESTATYIFNGTKQIGSKTYKEVWCSFNKDLSDKKPTGYCMYEDNGKVYIYNEQLEQEYLWFDFNLEVGDKFSFYVHPDEHLDATATVTAVADTILPHGDGRNRKCIHLSPDYYSGIMVEGIGSLSIGIEEFMIGYVGRGGAELLCCHEYDDLIYQSEDGTCFKSTGMEVNEVDDLSVKVECPGDGKLSFCWGDTSIYNLLSLYTEDGALYQKRVIPFGEHQLSVYGVSQGTYLYVLTAPDNKQCSGKVYVK